MLDSRLRGNDLKDACYLLPLLFAFTIYEAGFRVGMKGRTQRLQAIAHIDFNDFLISLFTQMCYIVTNYRKRRMFGY